MGVIFKYSKNIAKTGTKLLIPLLVVDTAWSLIRYILLQTVFNDTFPSEFVVIESIITNMLFTAFLGVLAAGMLMLGIYYSRASKFGIIGPILLIIEVGLKIAFIFFRFTQLIRNSEFMEKTIYIFELVTSSLLILAFILYDIFQHQLKQKENIGYGRGPFPYLFGFFALTYPISYTLNLFNVDFTSNNIVFSIIRTLAYTACILEILV